jgi:iron complex outermembrane receptor protein
MKTKLFFSLFFTIPLSVYAQNTRPQSDTALNQIVVTGSPLGETAFDQAQPVSALTGRDLKLKLAPSLGETLKGEPGISSSYFTPGASRPIIRGLADNRVMVLNNGTDIFDVSALSPDHAPSVSPLLSQGIEVVRGPATVLYGSSAIGGVVNVIDNRIATSVPVEPISGEVNFRFDSATLERSGAASFDIALTKNWVFHMDGTTTRTDSLHIPDYALSDGFRRELVSEQKELGGSFGGDPRHIVPNTQIFGREFGVGTTYVTDRGFIGFSFSQYQTTYGVPDDPQVDDPSTGTPTRTHIDMKKRQYSLHAGLKDPFPGFKNADLKFSYVDYKHSEFDGSELGSTFSTNGFDTRLELAQAPLGPLEGSIGIQALYRDFSVTGGDGFLQPTTTFEFAAFMFEEFKLSLIPLRIQAGARVEHNYVTIDSNNLELTPLRSGQNKERNFLPISAALGLIYDISDSTNAALTARYSERAPTAEELFAKGDHNATFQYLIGDPNLDLERVFGIDLSLKKHSGFITGSVGGFYNHFFNFIDFTPTGQFYDGNKGINSQHGDRVYDYASKHADFIGAEGLIQLHFLPRKIQIQTPTASQPDGKQIDSDVKRIVTGQTYTEAENLNDLYLELRTDYVYAQNRTDNEPLPRIPPLRFGGAIGYRSNKWDTRFEVIRVEDQDRTAQFETETPGYTMMNASLIYTFQSHGVMYDLYVKGTNLLDETARDNTSFLKDVLPLAGRGITTGIRFSF